MHGVTRAAISKIVKELQAELGIMCARGNKRATTSATYRETNVRRRKNTFIQ